MAYALVTGASGGIGLCLAQELAKRKTDLLLVARSEDKLLDIAKNLTEQYAIKAHVLSVDLSINNSYLQVLEWIEKNQWKVSILINNAGYGIWKSTENSPIIDLQNMMQLNMVSVVNLCHAFTPLLKSQPKSYILNVASTASYQAVPFLATYAASKSFVVLFSRGLRWELKDSSISVSCLSPGATSTGFIDRAGMFSLKEKAEKLSMTPEAVAFAGIEGMLKGKAEIIPGFINRLTVHLTYLLPKALIEKIAFGLYKI